MSGKGGGNARWRLDAKGVRDPRGFTHRGGQKKLLVAIAVSIVEGGEKTQRRRGKKDEAEKKREKGVTFYHR